MGKTFVASPQHAQRKVNGLMQQTQSTRTKSFGNLVLKSVGLSVLLLATPPAMATTVGVVEIFGGVLLVALIVMMLFLLSRHIKSRPAHLVLKQTIENVRPRLKHEELTLEDAKAVAEIFEKLRAWKDREKRALLHNLLCSDREIVVTGPQLTFEGAKGATIEGGRFIVTEALRKDIRIIGRGAVTVDMDDNIAPREEPFSDEMQSLILRLILGGLLIPVVITDNEYKKAAMRFKEWPDVLRHEIMVFADGAGNLYEFDPAGRFAINPQFRQSTQAETNEQLYRYIYDNLYKEFIVSWQPFYLTLVRYLNEHEARGSALRYDDIDAIEKVLHEIGKVLNWSETAFHVLARKALRRNDAQPKDLLILIQQELAKIYRGRVEEGKEERLGDLINIMHHSEETGVTDQEIFLFGQIVALMEIQRIIHSDAEADQRQRKDLLAHFIATDTHGIPLKDGKLDAVLRGGVQIGLKAIRPRLIRAMFVYFFIDRFEQVKAKAFAEGLITEQQERYLNLYPGGTTTINITDGRMSKAKAVEYLISERKVSKHHLYFSGDDMYIRERKELIGADDAVARLQKSGYYTMMVVNTNLQKHNEDYFAGRPHVLWTGDSPLTNMTAKSGKRQVLRPVFGPEANAMVFDRLLKIKHQKIDELWSLSSTLPASPAMDELRERLYPPDWLDRFKPSFGAPFSFGIAVIVGAVLLIGMLHSKDWASCCTVVSRGATPSSFSPSHWRLPSCPHQADPDWV